MKNFEKSNIIQKLSSEICYRLLVKWKVIFILVLCYVRYGVMVEIIRVEPVFNALQIGEICESCNFSFHFYLSGNFSVNPGVGKLNTSNFLFQFCCQKFKLVRVCSSDHLVLKTSARRAENTHCGTFLCSDLQHARQ